MTVYIDILFILNVYVTFLLIKATAAFTHRAVSKLRCAVGCALGGVSSLVILLPPLGLLGVFVKIAAGAVIAAGVFYRRGERRGFFRTLGMFIGVNLFFAGVTLGLYLLGAPFLVNNGVMYIDVSFAAVVLSTTVAYGAVRVVRYILDGKEADGRTYDIVVTRGGFRAEMRGFADSGNTFTDYFSGLPVVICDRAALGEIDCETGARLLPCNTATGGGLIPVFRADSVKIGGKNVNAVVGVSELCETQAIFNPKIII